MTQCPTNPGPWKYVSHDTIFTVLSAAGWAICSTPRFSDGSVEGENEVNASFIAEAGTVYHESGLMPRELLNLANFKDDQIRIWGDYHAQRCNEIDLLKIQRDDLLNALKSARRVMTDNGIRLMVGDTDVISAAIEKAEGK